MGCGYLIICLIFLFIYPPLGIFMLILGVLSSITNMLNKLNNKNDKK